MIYPEFENWYPDEDDDPTRLEVLNWMFILNEESSVEFDCIPREILLALTKKEQEILYGYLIAKDKFNAMMEAQFREKRGLENDFKN